MTRYTLNEIPPELVEPIGNLIRKTAYTQLRTVRLVGLGISEDEQGNTMYLATKPIEETTTLLDVIIKLMDTKVKDVVGNTDKNAQTSLIVKEVSFTDLKQALGEFVVTDSLADDLLITERRHVLKLAFMVIDKDMNTNSLQVLLPDGLVPIPCSVIREGEFKLDYTEKDKGTVSFEITDELGEQLVESINRLRDFLAIN